MGALLAPSSLSFPRPPLVARPAALGTREHQGPLRTTRTRVLRVRPGATHAGCFLPSCPPLPAATLARQGTTR